MSSGKRLFVAIGAPLVAVVGILCIWGFRNAAAMKSQVEAWADSLEHSASPVAMSLPFIPMYVDGRRVGSLEGVVVQRRTPGAVDSLRVIVGLADDADHLNECHFVLDPDAFDHEGPLGFKRAVRCVDDTSGLVGFGSVVLEGRGRTALLLLAPEDLPCNHMSEPAAAECTMVRDEIRKLEREVRDEVRVEIGRIRNDIRHEIRTNVRESVRSAVRREP